MKKKIIQIVVLLVLVGTVGGIVAVLEALDVIGEVFKQLFPVAKPYLEQAILDYLVSPYFIVSLILYALSSVGVFVSPHFKNWIIFSISILVNSATLLSIIMNLARIVR